MTRGEGHAHNRHFERERSNPASGHRSSAMSPNRSWLNHQLGCFAFARNDEDRRLPLVNGRAFGQPTKWVASRSSLKTIHRIVLFASQIDPHLAMTMRGGGGRDFRPLHLSTPASSRFVPAPFRAM